MWFAHCAMVLTPDLIKHEESTDATSMATKTRYNLDELVRRIAKIDL
jgi:BMFP domain-containing protein YqiC